MDLSISKFSFIAILGLSMLSGCSNQNADRSVGTDMLDNPATLNSEKSDKMPVISFEETEFYTGKITQGEVVNYSYKFENTGNSPLVISSVSASCGCTVPRNYPTGKIMPGEGGQIDVEFDSDNKWGEQTVTVNVVTNAIPSAALLKIKTNIVVPDNMKTTN